MNRPARIEGARRATNITLSGELVDQAKALGINLSQACEHGLAAAVKKACEDKWLEENRAALDSSNAYVEKHGLPLARYRDLLWRS
jgi:antitoxin CcdA